MYIVAYVFSFCLPKEFHFLAIFSRRLKRQALDLDYIMLRTIFFILRPSMGGFFLLFYPEDFVEVDWSLLGVIFCPET